MRWRHLLMVVIGIILNAGVCRAATAPAAFPSLLSAASVPESATYCGEKVPMESQEVRERFEKEFMLILWNRPQILLWLKRSRRYFPAIEKMLGENGMPADLKYVAVVESALRPHAGSKKGAVGFWQFMAQTGRKYGLTVNHRVDERRNLLASTRAAILYFTELHEQLSSWTLATAAFNMGEEGLIAETLEQGTDNYYDLYLPLETQRFIFQILSAKLIFSEPQKYGFELTEKDYYTPLPSDQVRIECYQEIPIRLVAQAAATYFKVIKDLNPELRGHYLASGVHSILVPGGASKGFQDRYDRLVKRYSAAKEERVYIVKGGDSLSSIAERFDIPLSALLIWNRLDLKRPIHPGDRLYIFPKEKAAPEGDIDSER
jgi:membrane-bound lytic murein transglycosylase D